MTSARFLKNFATRSAQYRTVGVLALLILTTPLQAKVSEAELKSLCNFQESGYEPTLCVKYGGKLTTRPAPSDAQAKQFGVERSELEKYLANANCILATGSKRTTSATGKAYYNPSVFCVGNAAANAGGVHESYGCTLFILNSLNGAMRGFGRDGKSTPQTAGLTCNNGGLKLLLAKDWGGVTIGQMISSQHEEIGFGIELLYAHTPEARKMLETAAQTSPAKSAK